MLGYFFEKVRHTQSHCHYKHYIFNFKSKVQHNHLARMILFDTERQYINCRGMRPPIEI